MLNTEFDHSIKLTNLFRLTLLSTDGLWIKLKRSTF